MPFKKHLHQYQCKNQKGTAQLLQAITGSSQTKSAKCKRQTHEAKTKRHGRACMGNADEFYRHEKNKYKRAPISQQMPDNGRGLLQS